MDWERRQLHQHSLLSAVGKKLGNLRIFPVRLDLAHDFLGQDLLP